MYKKVLNCISYVCNITGLTSNNCAEFKQHMFIHFVGKHTETNYRRLKYTFLGLDLKGINETSDGYDVCIHLNYN